MSQELSKDVRCAYCGHLYPDGTPTHQADLLTAHIKICEQHPMRQAEATIEKLRKALSSIIGEETKEGLEAMELAIRATPAPAEDKAFMIDGIHALLSLFAK